MRRTALLVPCLLAAGGGAARAAEAVHPAVIA